MSLHVQNKWLPYVREGTFISIFHFKTQFKVLE